MIDLRGLRERAGPAIALVAMCLFFGVLSPAFFSLDNFLNVARQIAIGGIVAVGMTLVIVTGGIDLSVGSVLALSICVMGTVMERGHGAPTGLAAGLVAGLACGAVNGLVITRLKISPFIATLGMMSFARGAALVLTGGNPLSRLDHSYFPIGTGSVLGVPSPVWVLAAIALAGGFVLARTRLGRYALAVGSNEEAVRLAGVPVHTVKLAVYVIMGGLAAVAGWILSARVASADPSAGVLIELEAIAAVVIGGASLSGGRGSVIGTLLGAAIMGVLANGLVLLGIGAFWQQLLVGVVIVAAVAVDRLRATSASATPAAKQARRRVLVAVGVIAVAGLAVAIARRPPVRGAAGGGGRPTIAVIGKASGGEYWLSVKAGAERKGRELDVEMLWLGTPSETEISKQVDLVENVIQQGVDAIALAPTDAKALSPLIKRAIEAGIPVITIDTDAEAKDRLAYVGTDNRAAGEAAGREMVRLLGGRGKVAIVTGVLGAQNLRQRVAGFRAGLEGSGVTVFAEQTDNGDRARGMSVAENLLTADPDLAGFFADTAIGGPAIAQALIARGLAGKVKLISFDTTPTLNEHLENGVAQALIAQRPERMGELAVELTLKRLRGEEIPALVDTGVTVVRKGGAADAPADAPTDAATAEGTPTGTPTPAAPVDSALAAALGKLGRDTAWKLEASTPLQFDAFHPQGLVRLGDDWFLSSVELLEPPVGGGPGKGRGHLFRFDDQGRRTADVALGEGDAYHPGGMAFDGRTIWVPVAEYRPASRSIVYRVDPSKLAAEIAFRVDDHLGALVSDAGKLVGATWGGSAWRAFDPAGHALGTRAARGGFLATQSCQAIGAGRAVCGGIEVLAAPGGKAEAGGLVFVNLEGLGVTSELRLPLYTPAGHVATRNPIWLEVKDGTIRLYAIPDDGRATLHVWAAHPE